MGYMMDDYEIGIAYEYENFPVLLPYHTLLLLEDPEEILKDIPLDANPTLVKLVQILVPYQWYAVIVGTKTLNCCWSFAKTDQYITWPFSFRPIVLTSYNTS